MKESINLMERMGLMEKSRSEKKKDVKRIENFFKKGNNNVVKCFAVLTAENPNSKKQSTKDNQKSNAELYDALKTQYTIIPTQGKFGNVENSFVVMNISLETAKYFCGKYEQTSFIYSKIDEDGQLVSEYWEKQDTSENVKYDKETNPYVLKDTCNDWVDMSDADDYYTIVGKRFKFSIPFSIFESYTYELSKMMMENNITNKEEMLTMLIEGVGYGAFYNRAKYRIKELM
jgi:hypothetical protein